MKLVIGLGNPGNRYNFTRHNVGFLALDFYFKIKEIEWNNKARYGAVWGRKGDVIFMKPQDFYNESGRAVREFVKFYKIELSDILVVCDDFNLDFGKIRYRSKGSAGGNNGLKSIISELNTEEFPRIRLCIENNKLRQKVGDTDFVISKFIPEEKEKLPEVLAEVVEKIDEIIYKNGGAYRN